MKKAMVSRDMLNVILIIGVVIAILFPTIFNIINKNIIKDKFKKSFGTISSAINISERDSETRSNCFYNPDGVSAKVSCEEYGEDNICKKWKDDLGYPVDMSFYIDKKGCESLSTSLESMMRFSQKCDKDAYQKGCIPKYKGFDAVYTTYRKRKEFLNKNGNNLTNGCQKWSDKNILHNASWVLNDGTIILFYGDKPDFSLFAMDVNGKMGPNKWGHDLFPMYLKSFNYSPLEINEGICAIYEKGGVTFKEIMH